MQRLFRLSFWIGLLFVAVTLGTVALVDWKILKNRSATITREIATVALPWDDSLNNDVKVFSVEKVSTGAFEPQDIRTTRVERVGSHSDSMTLPFTTDFAAQSAEVVSFGGHKELLLRVDAFNVAIVWVQENRFVFRPEADTLKSWAFEVGPHQIDRELVFVAASEFPDAVDDSVPYPRLFSWSRQRGFADVTKLHPTYVRNTLVPQLEAALMSETSPVRADYYRQLIAGLRATQM
jgi:hypothetical protein